MIKTKKRGNLIVVSGPSGCGKDTVINTLKKSRKDLWISISCTTREKRGNEKEGCEYFFLSKDVFKAKIQNNEFLEYALYNNYYYGTLKSNVENMLNQGDDVVLIIEVQGALKIKKEFDDAVFIFIMPPSMMELKKRLKKRGTENTTKILNRFKIAYQELNEYSKYNYVVVNDTIENAVSKINSILVAQKCRVDTIEELDVHTLEEVMHEELVDLKKQN